MAVTFETRVLELAGGPVDLSADVDISEAMAKAPPETGIRIFVQNVSTRAKVYYAERADAPARMGKGHCMAAGDGFVLHLRPTDPNGAWVWARSTGTVAVSPADR